MADTKSSALTALTGASLAAADLFVVVDASDTTMAVTGTNKKMTYTEVLAALSLVYQPLDTDLTAIAALTTTTFGRALLALADAAAARTALGLGTAATAASGDFDAAGAAAAAQAASQPVDADLTAIAALTTTAFGRGLLALADAAALRTSAGLDNDLGTFSVPASTTISAYGATLVDDADAATARATLGLGNAATLTVDADLATFALPASTTISAYGATLVDDADAATARTTLGLGTAATTAATAYATAAQGTTADGAVPKSLYDANTVLYATTDNTPVALTMGASTILGRKASGDIVALSGSEAATIVGLPTQAEFFTVALGDETTAITTGTKVTFRMPFAFTLTAVRASLTTASSSGIPTFDINEGGTTILSTKLTIDANERTSTTAATAAVISDAALADDAEMTIDVDVAGTAAAGAKITFYGTRA